MNNYKNDCQEGIDILAIRLAEHIDTIILYEYVTGKKADWSMLDEKMEEEMNDYSPNTGTIR